MSNAIDNQNKYDESNSARSIVRSSIASSLTAQRVVDRIGDNFYLGKVEQGVNALMN